MTGRRAMAMVAGVLGMAPCCGLIRADMGAIPFKSYSTSTSSSRTSGR